MLRREVVKMAGSLFGLGTGTPSRFPYPGRPQPAPGVGPGQSQNLRARTLTILSIPGSGIFGPDFIINASGSFYYSGTPAAGNLAESIVPGTTSVFDPFGNLALTGFTTYFHDVAHSQYIAMQVSVNTIIFLNAATEAGPWNATGNSITAGAGGGMTISGNGTPDGINLISSGGPLAITGAATVSSIFTATGGTAGSPSLVTTDTWHQVGVGGFSAFVNGWTNPGAEHLDVTLNADNTVTIAGRVNNAAGTAGNSLVCTLPAPYQTANRVEFAPADQTNAAVSHTVQLDTAGNFQVNGAVAAGGIIAVQARLPLGAPA